MQQELFPAPHQVAHPRLSSKYRLLPLSDVDSYAHTMGFSRYHITKGRGPFGVYIARYRPVNAPSNYEGPELVVRNSTDGSASLRVFLGFYRGACSNGMIFGEAVFRSGRMIHVGSGFHSRVEQAFDHAFEQWEKVVPTIDVLKNTRLTSEQVRDMVYKSILLREGSITEEISGVVARRQADMDTGSAWVLMNVMQEYIIRGGYRVGESKKKKAITSPSRIMELNTAITELFVKELAIN